MKRTIVLSGALSILVCLFAGIAISAETISIKISPHIIVEKSRSECVTVHTSIKFTAVDRDEAVTLGGVEAYLLKADDRGYLVAKFDSGAIKAIVSPPTATLTLLGTNTDGKIFSGTETVQVK